MTERISGMQDIKLEVPDHLFGVQPVTDMETWIEQTLLEAVAEERDPQVLIGFLAIVGEIAAQRQGLEYLAEEIKEEK